MVGHVDCWVYKLVFHIAWVEVNSSLRYCLIEVVGHIVLLVVMLVCYHIACVSVITFRIGWNTRIVDHDG